MATSYSSHPLAPAPPASGFALASLAHFVSRCLLAGAGVRGVNRNGYHATRLHPRPYANAKSARRHGQAPCSDSPRSCGTARGWLVHGSLRIWHLPRGRSSSHSPTCMANDCSKGKNERYGVYDSPASIICRFTSSVNRPSFASNSS